MWTTMRHIFEHHFVTVFDTPYITSLRGMLFGQRFQDMTTHTSSELIVPYE